MIEYKGYIGVVDFDPEIDLFHGTVINTQDVITFYGASVTELREDWTGGTRTWLTTYWGILSIAFSPDGTTLASGRGRISYLSNVILRRNSQNYPGDLVIGSGNRAHITMSKTGAIGLWNSLTGGSLYTLISSFPGSSLETWTVCNYENCRFCPRCQEEQRSTSTNNFLVSSVAFSPDGRILVGGGEYLNTSIVSQGFYSFSGGSWDEYEPTEVRRRYPLKLWDLDRKKLVILEGHESRVSSVAFSPNGKVIASGSWDDTIRLWNSTTGQHLTTYHGHKKDVNAVAFSPDGETLASGSDDDTIILWNPSGEIIKVLSGHTDNVTSVTFSPDGTTLASGSADSTIRFWNPSAGEHVDTLEGHTESVSSIAFSVDGGTLASGSWDNTVRLWDTMTGEHLKTFNGHKGDVATVAFSADGTTLASGSWDSTILLWEVVPAVSQDPLDVNGDGVINILDLAAVAARFGQTGQNPADVNGDGVVNVNDIILVAGAMGAVPAAPSINPKVIEALTTSDIQKWITQTKRLKVTNANMERGIAVLEQLLEKLMESEAVPAETTLLSNYPMHWI